MNSFKTIFKTLARELFKGIEFIWLKYTFSIAKREANRRHHLDGKTYWVIRLSYRFRVYSTVDIKELKKQGIFRRDLDHIKLSEIAAYSTNEINKR